MSDSPISIQYEKLKNKPLMVKTIFQVDKSYIRHAKPDGTGRDPSGS